MVRTFRGIFRIALHPRPLGHFSPFLFYLVPNLVPFLLLLHTSLDHRLVDGDHNAFDSGANFGELNDSRGRNHCQRRP